MPLDGYDVPEDEREAFNSPFDDPNDLQDVEDEEAWAKAVAEGDARAASVARQRLDGNPPRSQYVKLLADKTSCPRCGDVPWLITPLSLRSPLPAFYFCPCGYIGEVGMGEVPFVERRPRMIGLWWQLLPNGAVVPSTTPQESQVLKVTTTDLGFVVSTVFLGLDHGLGHSEWPILFETAVFPGHDIEIMERDRYMSQQEALAGHQRLVSRYSDHTFDLLSLNR